MDLEAEADRGGGCVSGGEPHFDAFALTTRLLEGVSACERSSDITSELIDVARDSALRRCFWTASGFEIALCTARHTAAIEDGISGIDPAGGQCFAGRANISVGAFVVAEVIPWPGARERECAYEAKAAGVHLSLFKEWAKKVLEAQQSLSRSERIEEARRIAQEVAWPLSRPFPRSERIEEARRIAQEVRAL